MKSARIVSATIVALAGAALSFASSSSAYASTAHAAAVRASEPPSCVTARYENPPGPYQDVYVHNGCRSTQRVRVMWDYAVDGNCRSIAAGATSRDHHLNQVGVDQWAGLESC
jgi:hypothetical protein